MILSDKTLLRMLEEKTLTVEPLERGQVQPASIDIRLGNTFCVVEDSPTGILELDKEIRYKTITADTYILLPNQFVLATTMEYLRLPDTLTAFVEGRSSLGRLGLFIQNAGWVDPGFEGEITLEMLEEITGADAKTALVGEEEQKQADSENVAQLAEKGEQE